jgi:hypothetical protein
MLLNSADGIMNKLQLLFLIAIAVFVSSCATLTNKPYYPVRVESNPPGVDLSVTNLKGDTIYRSITPAEVKLDCTCRREKTPSFTLHFQKENYLPRTVTLPCKMSGRYALNFFTGLTGFILDPILGGMYEIKTRYIKVDYNASGDSIPALNDTAKNAKRVPDKINVSLATYPKLPDSYIQKHSIKLINGNTLALNGTGMLFDDFSLFYESTKNDKRRFGISLGYMIAFNWWKTGYPSGIEFNDDLFAVGAYNGPEIRLYYEKLIPKLKKISFSGPELLFKYQFYHNATFIDSDGGDREDDYIQFTRSEKTFVVGFEYLFGNEFYYSHTFTQIVGGFGVRAKFRDINTLSSGVYGEYPYGSSFRPVGKKYLMMFIPTINFCIKFGTWVKKQSPNESSR